MNPFLHNPVAALPPGSPCATRARGLLGLPWAGRSPRTSFARTMSSLAIATGMSLAAAPAHALDVNTATAAQLNGIRGLGPKTVEVIIKERERGGQFESMEDLSDRVRGIGHKKAQALQAAGLSVDSVPAGGGARAGDAGKPAVRTEGRQLPAARPDNRGQVRNGVRPGGRAGP